MRIVLTSDIHAEMRNGYLKGALREEIAAKPDIFIIAGDLDYAQRIEETFEQLTKLFPDTDILYVPGNHDYWSGSMVEFRAPPEHSVDDELDLMLLDIDSYFERVHPLVNRSVVIDGITFHGATIWWNADNPEWPLHQHILNDFRYIPGYIDRVRRQGAEARQYLEANLEEGDVVITHHAPTTLSIPRNERFRDRALLETFYVNDYSELILDRKPSAWFHGHIHTPAEYQIGETLVASNPTGYPHQNSLKRAFILDEQQTDE